MGGGGATCTWIQVNAPLLCQVYNWSIRSDIILRGSTVATWIKVNLRIAHLRCVPFCWVIIILWKQCRYIEHFSAEI